MSLRAVLIRHNPPPWDDRVLAFLEASPLMVETCCPFKGEPLGEPDGRVAVTVIYGGPFVVTDTARHGFLHAEHRWLEQCLARGIPILALCQGAQSLARVLGAETGPRADGATEWGFYEITPSPGAQDWLPHPLTVWQRHFHGFEVPAGARHLASSALFPNQAFAYGEQALALQFHAEQSPAGRRRWQNEVEPAFWQRLGAQDRATQERLAARHDAAQAAWLEGAMRRLFGPALSRAVA